MYNIARIYEYNTNSYSKLNFDANPNFYIVFNAFSYILVITLCFPKENIGKLHTQSRISIIKLKTPDYFFTLNPGL